MNRKLSHIVTSFSDLARELITFCPSHLHRWQNFWLKIDSGKPQKVVANCNHEWGNLCHRLQGRGGKTNVTQSLPMYLPSFCQRLAPKSDQESNYRMLKPSIWRFSSKIDQIEDFEKVKMSLGSHQKCSHRLRSFLALLETQAKCERHLDHPGRRVGGVANVEKWPFLRFLA